MFRVRNVLLLAATLLVGLGCEDGKLQLQELPRVDLGSVPLPKLKTGNLVLIDSPLGGLQLDPNGNDAITALGACTDRITYCFQPGEHSLDQCVEAVPQCQTSKPWQETACCPAACTGAYAQARASGQEPIAAFEKVFFLEPDCFPGVRSLMEGK